LVPFTANFIYGSLLTANNSLRKMNGLFLAAILLNVSLNLLVIPGWKAAGVGAVAFITQSFVLAGQIWFVKKELNVGMEARQILKVSAFSVLAVLLAWQLYALPTGHWLVKFCAAVSGGLVLAFVFRLIRLQTLLELAKSKS
jgi:O-antigen/teichoic acid export membrane protein